MPLLDRPPPSGAETARHLLFSSARAPPLFARHPLAAPFQRLPALCVGEATARAARLAGFAVAQAGKGGLGELVGALGASDATILAPGHARPTRVMLPPGIRLLGWPIYDMAPVLALRPRVASLLAQGRVAAALLMSAETARHFAGLYDGERLPRAMLALAALSPKVAAAAGPGWRAVRVASRPTAAALLASARPLWQ